AGRAVERPEVQQHDVTAERFERESPAVDAAGGKHRGWRSWGRRSRRCRPGLERRGGLRRSSRCGEGARPENQTQGEGETMVAATNWQGLSSCRTADIGWGQ